MASSKKRKQKLIGANKRPERSSEEGEGVREAPKASVKGTGLNRIPVWLHRELGLSDTLAGSLVVLASGGLIMALVYLLAILWPAG